MYNFRVRKPKTLFTNAHLLMRVILFLGRVSARATDFPKNVAKTLQNKGFGEKVSLRRAQSLAQSTVILLAPSTHFVAPDDQPPTNSLPTPSLGQL